MDLRNIDLNLLLLFSYIYKERSISRAAIKLNLSQSAVSNSLAKLRERLQDPLFTRTSRGMAPTLRAKQLAEPITQALDLIQNSLKNKEAFDYSISDRTFIIAVEDYGEAVILPRFIDWLSVVAPNVRIKIRPEPSLALKEELEKGQVDLALDYFVLEEKKFHNHCVMTETLLSMTRSEHPEISEKLNLDTYLKLRHVALIPRSKTMPMIDLALAKRGLQRQIAVEVPHFLSMPFMVQKTNLICTLPKRMATLYSDYFQLRLHTPPLRIPQFPIYLIWHESLQEDVGHKWLRNSLIEICQRL
ncbi:MAG: LysR family transcriptional regulator [Polynucleobacter sp.]|uniref:LysR family transcriptional regulator n=1 Tax=Polynucleobacter sp. TaxID=2029855 RepID=UPI00271C40EE|nr:LysR family transcriptional regulator [Polynucleobacter sp.]MDO8713478.1 LysR family transcriptional regulator [Polynucleobacter sp.]